MALSLEEIRLHGYIDVRPGGEADRDQVVNTPSGKIEIYSETLAKAGFRPACRSGKSRPSPKPGEFYLLTGKVGQHTQFGTQNNQLLHKYQDVPRLWMAPEALQRLGLKDWDWSK